MQKENTYVVLVNYCTPNITADCIDSLLKAGLNPSQIIVVDNNSVDNSIEVLSRIKGIVFISSKINGGFSYGNNIGIQYAIAKNCSSVILLNNDTIVATDFFEKIFDCPVNCVAVPKIYYYSNPQILWYAGGKIDYIKGRQLHFGENKMDGKKYSIKRIVDYATGCCMMIPRSVLDKVGFLDENYFMYWEDMDYSLRLKRTGVKIYYLPEAKVWHKVGMSGGSQSKMAIYYSNRNRFFLLKKYGFGITARIYAATSRLLKVVFSFIYKSNDRVIIKAWRDYKKGIMGKIEI